MLIKEVLGLLMLAFLIVGVPALILKLATIWFVRSTANKARLRLLGLSLIGCSLAGAVTVACYAVLTAMFEFDAQRTKYLPQPLVLVAAAIILVVLVAAVEFFLWRRFCQRHGSQPRATRAGWLVAGNVWVLWAILLMDQYRDVLQLTVGSAD
jgi:hypothetical protein